MNWDDLKYILALADGGTLSAAARALGVSHATVARRIAAVEELLPTPAFDKSASGYELTPLGSELLEVARATQTQIFRFERIVSAWETTPTGRVRLAIPGFFGPLLSAKIVAAIKKEHPGILLEIFDGQTYADLRRQEADLAVRLFLGSIKDDPAVRIRKLGDLNMSLFATSEFARDFGLSYPVENLSDVPLVRYSDLAPANPGFEWIQSRANRLNIVVECNSLNAAFACIGEGLGAGCIPDFWAERAGLVRLSDPLLTAFGAIAMHPDMARSPRVRLVADVLVKALRGDAMPFRP